MFEPVSAVNYDLLLPSAQALVIFCPVRQRRSETVARWATRACAVTHDAIVSIPGIVRDLLANPHVRALVFDGETCSRRAWNAFFEDGVPVEGIDAEHLALVRQFVGVYDDDFTIKKPMQPYWPARIRYSP